MTEARAAVSDEAGATESSAIEAERHRIEEIDTISALYDAETVQESYENEAHVDTPYFPATSAMVTAPGCGHLMYGQITQIDHGNTGFSTYASTRVPKFCLDQEHDTRKLRLGTRPLAAPQTYCPYIYAADVVS